MPTSYPLTCSRAAGSACQVPGCLTDVLVIMRQTRHSGLPSTALSSGRARDGKPGATEPKETPAGADGGRLRCGCSSVTAARDIRTPVRKAGGAPLAAGSV